MLGILISLNITGAFVLFFLLCWQEKRHEDLLKKYWDLEKKYETSARHYYSLRKIPEGEYEILSISQRLDHTSSLRDIELGDCFLICLTSLREEVTESLSTIHNRYMFITKEQCEIPLGKCIYRKEYLYEMAKYTKLNNSSHLTLRGNSRSLFLVV